MPLKKFQQGFTLIELLLYLGIVVVVISVASVITFNVLFSRAKVMAIREVTQNARLSMDKVSQEVRNADSITSPSSGKASSTLEITKEGKQITFDKENGTLVVERGGNSPVALTSNEVEVTELKFSDVSYSDTPRTIRIHMKFNFNTNSNLREYEFEEDFYTTASLR